MPATCPHCGHVLSDADLNHLWQAFRSRGGHAAAQVVDTVSRARKAANVRWGKQKAKAP